MCCVLCICRGVGVKGGVIFSLVVLYMFMYWMPNLWKLCVFSLYAVYVFVRVWDCVGKKGVIGLTNE